jgi:transposase
MLLAHRIRLEPTPRQCDYFARAAGTARQVWNWALAEWQRQIAAGLRPNAMALKKEQFNAIQYSHPDWLDSEGQVGKSRLSGTNIVTRTVRGTKRTLRILAHIFDSRRPCAPCLSPLP